MLLLYVIGILFTLFSSHRAKQYSQLFSRQHQLQTNTKMVRQIKRIRWIIFCIYVAYILICGVIMSVESEMAPDLLQDTVNIAFIGGAIINLATLVVIVGLLIKVEHHSLQVAVKTTKYKFTSNDIDLMRTIFFWSNTGIITLLLTLLIICLMGTSIY
ncbi:MAG: hypothetical protein LKG79_09420 [Furfurilactobacillus sp.]|jgi:hypothetical protein|uniref:DUF3899 domain-containing protein n=1 Tax=Furfurilactobacillus milii TaxID=2888272 RepID=A0ABT6D7X1_9LACO|nr:MULTISPECIES: hypothetical protein [Furfurilactobacillus]QLE65822.1 hypothetical protein LROSL2_0469 [Furfurilactobacillus rossiae]MCF6160269.1 hypothetical protein [Furfurilactobacillus milii]MCF6162212.1 hypothetical protein [Furfurilactobacillus milii]MCF6420445.1 hypothetical protein [Furfurilactobacillus milii]MCH4012343.1 hypothetical protein [Furfurilactobacillus sp.]